MLQIIKDVKSKVPQQIPGFICIKSQEILIPYMELGIDCLTRNISDLNLFFETVLKLIELDVKNIDEISTILGVSFQVIKEAIVDMVSINYISVSENTLRITNKGKDALKSKKLIETKKSNLNNIMINLITGAIVDGDNMKAISANRNSVCLAEKIKVDKDFLDANFQNLNQIFQIKQEANNVFGRMSITKELYKLISIHYQNLKYIRNYVRIYKSETSEELQFIFDYDDNDIYLDTLYEQLQTQSNPCLENFFERSRQFKENPRNLFLNEDLYDISNELRKEISQNNKSASLDPNSFCVTRYTLFDNEYTSYFYNSNHLNFSQLFICTNRINSLLSPSIYKEILRISEKTPVFLLYDKNEFNANGSIEHFLGNTPRMYLHIIPCQKIDESVICFNNELLIEVNEYTINTLGNTLSYKMPIIYFDSFKTNDWVSNTMQRFDIDANLLEIKKQIKRKKRKKRH